MEGVLCQMDDFIGFRRTTEEHDKRLKWILKQIEVVAILNRYKGSFGQSKIKFLVHIIAKDGISVHPDKTRAISEMKIPSNVTELRRFSREPLKQVFILLSHINTAFMLLLGKKIIISESWDQTKMQYSLQSSRNWQLQLYWHCIISKQTLKSQRMHHPMDWVQY